MIRKECGKIRPPVAAPAALAVAPPADTRKLATARLRPLALAAAAGAARPRASPLARTGPRGLLDEKYTLELRRIVAEESAKSPFDEVDEVIAKSSLGPARRAAWPSNAGPTA